jgi:hypothetical protein
MGTIAVTMLMSIITLARWTQIHYAEDPAIQLAAGRRAGRRGLRPGHRHGPGRQGGLLGLPAGVVLVSVVTGLILFLAANTAFNGFPVLGSILAKDGYLPRQLHNRGDRLAFSNGILILASAAAALIVVYNAEVTKLIQLYIVGVFVSFTLSQIGMIRHWNRHLAASRMPRPAPGCAQPGHQRIGATMSGTVLARRARHEVPPRRRVRDRGDGGSSSCS